MYEKFFDYIFYRISFNLHKIKDIMAGFETADINHLAVEKLPDELKKSSYDEISGISLLSSIQFMNVLTIMGFLRVDTDNINTIIFIIVAGIIISVYNTIRYKFDLSFLTLYEKWKNKKRMNHIFTRTKIYFILSFIIFIISAFYRQN